ncbi:tetratricopeptide repeat-containing sensor histidine kinase [Flavobacterium sp.]|uniref:tetratricopeptide repeat-containing sensor histidine kinase n=1 Tax=Flavobacterium sp. TaxID=239 RepID=UPI002FDE1E53
MKLKLIILVSFLFFSCTKNKNPLDSVKQNSDSLTYYYNLSEKEGLNKLQVLKNLDKALQISFNLKNTQEKRDIVAEIAFKYYELGIDDQFNKSSDILLKDSYSSKDSINLGKAYRCKATYHKNIQSLDSSYYYFVKSEKLYHKPKEQLVLANILLNKGIVQYLKSDFLGAELSLTRAYSIFKDSEKKDKLYATLNQIGLVYNELKEYDKAVFFHTKALETVVEFKLQNEDHQEAVCYNNLGYLYLKLKDYPKSISNFEAALKDKSILKDDPDLYALLIDNLAYSRLQSSNFKDLPNLFFEALNIRQKLNDPTVVVGSYIHLSEYYDKIKNKKEAIRYSELALKKARSSNIANNVVLALKQASIVDTKNSFSYSDEYIKISDSLQIAERNSKDRFAKIQLETDEIIQEKEGLAEKNRNLLYVFVVSFILVVLLFVVRAQRARTRELLYKQAQQKANEDIYNLMMSQQAIIDESRSKEKKRLAQDLHDGVLGRMFGLRLNLDSLNSSTDEEAVQRRFELLNELKTIEQDIREISHDLNREKQVLINNFVSIVHNLLEEQKNAFEANVNYAIDDTINWDKIGNTIKINLYRILQEGLQNINKYANAKNIWVEISGNAESVSLTIQDDGIGFDVNRKSKGIGMQNMISRTHDCKGIIDIQSKKDQGTKIIITVPIETKQPETITQE